MFVVIIVVIVIVMIVIVVMAGDAGCGQLIGKWVFAVAIITCECRVLPGQTE